MCARSGLSQAQFATKFGFPPATLRNWEQGRSRPDAPTRALAVIAKHAEAVEDVRGKPVVAGGEGGIRTPGRVFDPTTV
jgi:transcriptional regulator with XRE-family HTH domain